ncbi:hypothetical protein DXG01_003163 [Tephrocybe rancida]|nr:hypothetical protein DXG01_003163 [Tephrocybe rancida]
MPYSNPTHIALVDIPGQDHREVHRFPRNMTLHITKNGDIQAMEGPVVREIVGLNVQPGEIVRVHIFEYNAASFTATNGRNFVIERSEELREVDVTCSNDGHPNARYVKLSERGRLPLENTFVSGMRAEPRSVDSGEGCRWTILEGNGAVTFIVAALVYNIGAYYAGHFLINCGGCLLRALAQAYNANYFSINFLINYGGRLLQSLVQAYDANCFSINYAGRILQSLAQGLQRGADRMSLDA